ncbi:MAG: hypothetical protein AAFP98_11115, partial [Pseudomonadota bacterium]
GNLRQMCLKFVSSFWGVGALIMAPRVVPCNSFLMVKRFLAEEQYRRVPMIKAPTPQKLETNLRHICRKLPSSCFCLAIFKSGLNVITTLNT